MNKGIVRCVLEPTTKTHEDRRVYVLEWVRPYLNRLPFRIRGEWLFLNRYSEWIDEFSKHKDDSDLGGGSPKLASKQSDFLKNLLKSID